MNREAAKKAAARQAATLIQNGMIVGLGSGTTAAYFIESLALRAQEGLQIQTIASSRQSADLAKNRGLLVCDINGVPRIDITVDGADEIDTLKRMIKGAGGAHVREKILASASNEMVVVIDETKRVPSLGKAKLPVEILFYGSPATRMKIESLGFSGKWRMNENQTLFVTENGNLIFDIHFSSLLNHPEQEHQKLIGIPGVIDTGFFFGLAQRVVIGYGDGSTKMFSSLA